ncbi:restriction endonuclease [Bradyrhizobium sp. 2TAF24]|uniref:restriction endonuclease n=1 Tax=Bradyrhizobium sp. 2TAF24 TaxID=3233011 RepID=UPI003F92D5DF
MSNSYLIEVAVPEGTSNTERGRVLERFARRFLETQNYKITEELRVTASEIDLLGCDKTTGERIFVECKAHRAAISSEVLQKLLGNITFKNYSAGWLISTFALGKDAKGFEDEWNQRPPEERRKLRIYPPEKLVERLVAARIIVDVDSLVIDRSRFRTGSEAYLLITQTSEFWALPVLAEGTGIQIAALLFDASNGNAITDSATLDWIDRTDRSLQLPWISDSANPTAIATATSRLALELESIVGVPVADHWADYRPARPEDFVGRETVQNTIFGFLDSVRTKATETRLVAIKAPSGWGKSSSVLKIASRATNVRNRGKYFIFTVDSRAATTRRFPELAVASAIREAGRKDFISLSDSIDFGGATSFFSTSKMKTIGETLKQEEKVICVFFDQFEELLYKADLVEVFEEMRRICAAVEESQINIVIGFSWKTDGVIPTEHNAYHMWHTLADRRFEIELAPFTENEVVLAINRFSKELDKPVIPQLRRVLQDHCQGFPWLLKKLCVHILDLSKSGIDQTDILNRSINIQNLFKKDLENLSSAETACIKQIATESPAEFFKVVQNFGEEIVSRLVDKRLVIRSGTRLTIYWDIFRDYILTEKIPYIPVTYVPQANFSRYVKALAYMVGKNELSYHDLATQMNLGMGAADNLVRDLVNLGHVDANRKEHRIEPTFKDEARAIEIAHSFWRSHEVVRRLLATRPSGGAFRETEFVAVYRAANKRSALGDNAIKAYAMRMLRWLIGIDLVRQDGNNLILRDAPALSSIQSLEAIVVQRSQMSEFFLGEAPPSRVLAAYRELSTGAQALTRMEIEKRHGRNTCYALIKLGLMDQDGSILGTTTPEVEVVIATRARSKETVAFVCDMLAENPLLLGAEIGRRLAKEFRTEWSDGSHRRHGGALRKWAKWVNSVTGTANPTLLSR